jgi:hypothetical protein
MTNQFGTSIKIYGATVITDIEGGLGKCTFKLGTDIPADASDPTKLPVWKDGESKEFSAACDGAENALVAGDKVKLGVEFKWFPSSSSDKFAKTMSGELFTAVQEK